MEPWTEGEAFRADGGLAKVRRDCNMRVAIIAPGLESEKHLETRA